jgi:adenylate cyclase
VSPTTRPHTFLFTDLVGFTALTADRGDDGAADVCQHFYARVRALLDEHEAHEVKTLGDGLMLRGSDPALAIGLGLKIVDELEELDSFPAVRVGMHTGPAVERAGDWYGTTVNVAARLCSAAGGGEVLVSDSTRQAAGRLRKIALEEERLHWLKNLNEPVPAHLASARECSVRKPRFLRQLKVAHP